MVLVCLSVLRCAVVELPVASSSPSSVIAQVTDSCQPLSSDAAASVPASQADPSSAMTDNPPGELNLFIIIIIYYYYYYPYSRCLHLSNC